MITYFTLVKLDVIDKISNQYLIIRLALFHYVVLSAAYTQI